MEAKELSERLLAHYGIRVEPHMADYVLRRLNDAGAALGEIPVIAGDARTGMPLRKLIDPSVLVDLPSPPST
jgi:hypothetical protein